jgi:hypothetical protein
MGSALTTCTATFRRRPPLTLSRIDTATNSVSTDVDVGGAPVNIAIFA